MDQVNYKHSELTQKVIGLAMKVHSKIGLGFPEKVYQRALAIELRKAGINFVLEKAQDVFYDNEWVGTRRVDFIIENILLVEIKAISEMASKEYNQIQNYLEAFNMEVGLLINFGCPSLKFNRFVNKLFHQ